MTRDATNPEGKGLKQMSFRDPDLEDDGPYGHIKGKWNRNKYDGKALSAKARKACALRVGESLNCIQIAERVGLSVWTVREILASKPGRRLQAKLQDKLDEQWLRLGIMKRLGM